MNLREALAIIPEHMGFRAIEQMTIEELWVALKDISDPEFSKFQHLRPKIEAILRAKIDARDAASAQLASEKQNAKLRTAKLALLIGALGLTLSLLQWLRTLVLALRK